MNDDKVIRHYGIPRRSGRYPYGSGKDPYQKDPSLLGSVQNLKNKGLSETEIAKGLGMTTTKLRTAKTIEKAQRRSEQRAEAVRLKDKGMSNVAIAAQMGLSGESSVRALLNPTMNKRGEILKNTTDMLKNQVDKKGLIDVGAGVESQIGISRNTLDTAIAKLQNDGTHKLHYVKTEQLGTGKFTTIKVLSKADVPYSEVFKNQDKIQPIQEYSVDHGRSVLGLEPIRNVGRERVHVRYAEDGGSDKDGVIELRRNIDDISLGHAKYAQVRIGVDGNMYMKGMAMYSDAMPKGVDIIYNTKKHRGATDAEVFKSTKDDKDNPFGTTVRQQHFITEKGKTIPNAKEMLDMKTSGMDYKDIAKKLNVPESTVRSAITVKALNIVNEEGKWGEWSNSISSQVLSKQSTSLARKQLGLALKEKQKEFDEIQSLTNPTVKKHLLTNFADDADASAVHLKAAALPRQATHVILPIPSMKETEVYAPNFHNGERVVLIRHPHGGTFEIPELTVNNKNGEANRVMKGAKDAIGIHPNVAKKLSGADFDGDTVLVIPNNNRSIKTSAPLKSLEGFDPIDAYPHYEGMPRMTPKVKQQEMGKISNLITDMTIKGAKPEEIARAVKHSMVVIDAEKHYLDYKRSARDNGIPDLKKTYQGGPRSGASTLISRSSAEIRVPERKGQTFVNPTTGEKIVRTTGRSFVNKEGKLVVRTTKTTRMAEVANAFELSSGSEMESVYANYANNLKAMANKARKLERSTRPITYSPTARLTFAPEVESLNAKLNIAERNRPRERQAQLLANHIVRTKKLSNPGMEESDLKTVKGQALAEARSRTGAHKTKIDLTDKEWEAIQLGAISSSKLSRILLNTDIEKIKTRATPRTSKLMTASKIAKARALINRGHTAAEVASALGVSTSTLQLALD